MSDTTSDDDELFTDKFIDKSVDLKPTKPTVPFTPASFLSSKPMSSSKFMGSCIVDQSYWKNPVEPTNLCQVQL